MNETFNERYTNMFKLVHCEARTVSKRAVGILLEYFIITRPQRRSCGNVMFSQVSCVSAWGGCTPPPPTSRHPLGRQPPGRHPLGKHPLQQMATATDGIHPTRMHSCYRLQRSWGKVIFSEACVKNSVHRGVCMAGGHARRGGCVVGGMCGRGCLCGGGACVAGGGRRGGHVWRRVCMAEGGMRGREGRAWQGACVAGGVRGRYYEIRSMSGRYTSYWNAFLF